MMAATDGFLRTTCILSGKYYKTLLIVAAHTNTGGFLQMTSIWRWRDNKNKQENKKDAVDDGFVQEGFFKRLTPAMARQQHTVNAGCTNWFV